MDVSVSRKMAIVAFLSQGAVPLSELARRFGQKPAEMRKEIDELFCVEIPSGDFFESVFDFAIDDDAADPMVELTSVTAANTPSLTLAEVISVLALVDAVLATADPHTAETLTTLRERLTEATENAGYGSVLWAKPSPIGIPQVVDVLRRAIAERRWVEISYDKSAGNRAIPVTARIAPVEINTAGNPQVITGNSNGELRHYRVDRISSAELTDQKFLQKFARDVHKQRRVETPLDGEQVTLHCNPAARWVVETIPVESWEQTEEGLTIRIKVRSVEWLRTLLVRLGTDVHRIEPPAIASQVAEQARALLAARGSKKGLAQ